MALTRQEEQRIQDLEDNLQALLMTVGGLSNAGIKTELDELRLAKERLLVRLEEIKLSAAEREEVVQLTEAERALKVEGMRRTAVLDEIRIQAERIKLREAELKVQVMEDEAAQAAALRSNWKKLASCVLLAAATLGGLGLAAKHAR